ncbi:unnamed protein product [Boreogadus saida]
MAHNRTPSTPPDPLHATGPPARHWTPCTPLDPLHATGPPARLRTPCTPPDPLHASGPPRELKIGPVSLGSQPLIGSLGVSSRPTWAVPLREGPLSYSPLDKIDLAATLTVFECCAEVTRPSINLSTEREVGGNQALRAEAWRALKHHPAGWDPGGPAALSWGPYI